jgi:FkbM family methyltransferase
MQLPKAIRALTDPIIGRIPVPIVGGENRGRLWSLASAGGGYMSGRRGAAQIGVISALLHEGDVVWDVGAHHGSIVLCASRRVGPSGQVHAFEPASLNLTYLGRHVRWNRLGNTKIHPYAMSSSDGETTFGGSGSSTGYRMGRGDEKVTVKSATSIVKSGIAPAPTFAKIDVEELEGEVLTGAASILRQDTRLIISVHSAKAYANCTTFLRAAGYDIVESRELAANVAGSWHDDPDMVCFGPAYAGKQRDRDMLKSLGF